MKTNMLIFFKRKVNNIHIWGKYVNYPIGNYKEEHQFVTHDGSMEMILTQSLVKMYFYKPKMSCIINLIFLQDSTPHTIKQ